MEHLKRSFDFTATHKGPHGLPLIGRADWNDCLNLNCFSAEPGESFQTFGPSEGPVAESVFIAGMFVKYGEEYARLVSLFSAMLWKQTVPVRRLQQSIRQSWIPAGTGMVPPGLRCLQPQGRLPGNVREGQILSSPRASVSSQALAYRKGLHKKLWILSKTSGYQIRCHAPAVIPDITWSLARSLLPAWYKENAGIFCHNNPGFPSQKPSSAERPRI